MFHAQALAGGVSLVAEVQPPSTPAMFDPARILQVLTNLLSNAIKFTPQGGRVDVHVGRVGDELHFAVSDTGLGIPADKLDVVFERFRQVTTNDRRGLGLGLYISKCIVQGHGGRIWAESAVGEGSKKQSAFERGRDERPFCLFIEDESLSDSDLASSIVRGFVGHPVLEVHTTSKKCDPHLEVEKADEAYPDDVARVFKIGSRENGAGFVRYASQKAALAARYAGADGDAQELTRKILLADYAELHGSDAFVTACPELRSIANETAYQDVNIMSPNEAVALVGLFLRLRQDYAYFHSGASTASYGKRGFYGLLAGDLLPEFRRWLDACPETDPLQSSPYKLAASVLIRIERALYARDHVHEHLQGPQDLQTNDDALFYFDAFLNALAGAFDAIGRVVHLACGMRDKPRRANWRDRKGKNDSWTDELAVTAPTIADLMSPEKPHRDALELIFLLRNWVHAEGLSSVPVIEDPDRLEVVEHQLLLPPEDNPLLLGAMNRLGGPAAWGIRQIDRDAYLVCIPAFVEAVLRRALGAMGAIMAQTPVEALGWQPPRASGAVLDPREKAAVERIRLLAGLG